MEKNPELVFKSKDIDDFDSEMKGYLIYGKGFFLNT